MPGQELERLGIGPGQDVGLLHPAEPVDGRPVEGHPLVEGVLQLRRRDVEPLGGPEDVGEPQLDEADAALLDRSQYVVALALHPTSFAGAGPPSSTRAHGTAAPRRYPGTVEGAPVRSSAELLEIPVGRARLAVARQRRRRHAARGVPPHRHLRSAQLGRRAGPAQPGHGRRGLRPARLRRDRLPGRARTTSWSTCWPCSTALGSGRGRAGRQLAGRPDRPGLHPDPPRPGRRPGPGGAGRLGCARGRRAQIDPVEAAIWETLEAAEAAGALDALNLGEIRLWVDGPHAPEGRVGGAVRELALDMNRIALHAASPGLRVRGPLDAWSRLSEVHCPVLVVVGDLDLVHIQRAGRGARLSHRRARSSQVMEGAAHLPGLEQPGRRSPALLRDFLAAGRANGESELRAGSLEGCPTCAWLPRSSTPSSAIWRATWSAFSARSRRPRRPGADICVVPELAIPGYPPEDLLLKPTFVADNVAALEKVAAATGQCAIVVGYVGADPGRAGAVQCGRALRRRAGGGDLPEAVPAQLRRLRRAALVRVRATRRRRSSGWPAPGWGSRCARTCGSPTDRWRSRAGPGPTWWSTSTPRPTTGDAAASGWPCCASGWPRPGVPSPTSTRSVARTSWSSTATRSLWRPTGRCWPAGPSSPPIWWWWTSPSPEATGPHAAAPKLPRVVATEPRPAQAAGAAPLRPAARGPCCPPRPRSMPPSCSAPVTTWARTGSARR